MRRAAAALLALLVAGCDAAPAADWVLSLDPAAPAGALSPALLGQYDLSGDLYHYDDVDGLAAAMAAAGLAEWRVGVGRWEAGTLLLPALTDGTACPIPLPALAAPEGWTDLDLIEARDWLTDDGLPATLADTEDDGRYHLEPVRGAIDVAEALGARPYVSIDLMPRALSINREPERTTAAIADACEWTFTNRVSNAPPGDPEVFAAAAAGLVRRVVEGSGGEPGRRVTHWEVWNEPEHPSFWDRTFDPTFERFLAMTALTLVHLAAYRESSTLEWASDLRFGFGSFATAEVAASAIEAFDGLDIPGVGAPPADFVSFHAYDDDPLEVVRRIEAVAAARDASTSYGEAELVLAEWGPDLSRLGDRAYNETLDPALLLATVVALGAAAGLSRAHHAIFYDYAGVIEGALVGHGGELRPRYHAFALMAALLGQGGRRLPPAGHEDGRYDDGLGAVLAVADGSTGAVRALVVNRGDEPRTVSVDLAGEPARPARLLVLDDPAAPPREVPIAGTTFTAPPRSIALVEL